MKFTPVEEILEGELIDKEVHLRGWIHRIRKQKNMVFAIVRDHTGVIQTVIKNNAVSEDEYEAAQKMLIESLVKIRGTVKEDARAKGGYEIQVSKLEVLHFADEFPITEDQSIEFLNDNRHLWMRSRAMTNALKVRDEVFRASREYLRNNGFFETTSPMFVSTMGEEGAELFEVDYFGDTMYLTQTSQMHLEPQLYALERVFTLAPSFRGEKSRTRKHLTEFWHLEAEEAWCDHDCNIERQEELISHICHSVAENEEKALDEMEVSRNRLLKIEPPFDRITYSEAIEFCQDAGVEISWGEDIRTEAEDALTEGRETFLFIEYYPKEIKSFYMKNNEKDPRTYKNNDLLAPEGFGEIIGGSQREDDPDILVENIKATGDDPSKYEWFVDIRKYGSVPHSGFGVGIDRLIRWMLDLDHIRDVIPFPRTVRRTYP
ncbi:MAG: asparagine--tRNA ligase [Candidatus Lokiarchaeota archaeon]|nr:asparagine--tRNA ligase [Candidatus Lokiarchaeota archaeon]